MGRNLKFFYFGYQCPHNAYLLARIKTIAWQERAPLELYDFASDEAVCSKYRIFSPTMLLVNDELRWHGPFTREQVLAMLDGDEEMEPRAYTVDQSDDVVRGDLQPITPQTALSTCEPCTGSSDTGFCRGKAEWVGDTLRSAGLSHLGYLHFMNGRCVGGAEFLPSTSVPYPIPDKRKDNAYLTCSFLSDDKKDFRTHPLMRLIEDLRMRGFTTLSTAASKEVVFPNGPMSWFERKGFRDKGVLITEELHRAEIHYMQLEL